MPGSAAALWIWAQAQRLGWQPGLKLGQMESPSDTFMICPAQYHLLSMIAYIFRPEASAHAWQALPLQLGLGASSAALMSTVATMAGAAG